jgi:hypothetical protein
MKFTLSYIPLRLFPAIMLVVFYALMQALAFHPLVPVPFGLLLLKSAVDAVILAGAAMLLMIIIPSSNYVKLNTAQRVINYAAIGLLFVILWMMAGFLSSYTVFGKDHLPLLRILFPVSAFIGSLLYVIVVQAIHSDVRNRAEEAEVAGEPAWDDAATPVATKEDTDAEVLERVAVKTGQKIHVIHVPDIIYIQSDGDYVQIVTEHNKYLKEETMKYFEASLPRSQFVRVHRSYIVNVEKILRVELYEKQSQMLTLRNGDKVRTSVSGYKALRSVLSL